MRVGRGKKLYCFFRPLFPPNFYTLVTRTRGGAKVMFSSLKCHTWYSHCNSFHRGLVFCICTQNASVLICFILDVPGGTLPLVSEENLISERLWGFSNQIPWKCEGKYLKFQQHRHLCAADCNSFIVIKNYPYLPVLQQQE